MYNCNVTGNFAAENFAAGNFAAGFRAENLVAVISPQEIAQREKFASLNVGQANVSPT